MNLKKPPSREKSSKRRLPSRGWSLSIADLEHHQRFWLQYPQSSRTRMKQIGTRTSMERLHAKNHAYAHQPRDSWVWLGFIAFIGLIDFTDQNHSGTSTAKSQSVQVVSQYKLCKLETFFTWTLAAWGTLSPGRIISLSYHKRRPASTTVLQDKISSF